MNSSNNIEAKRKTLSLFNDIITPAYDWSTEESILDFSLSKGLNITSVAKEYKKIVSLALDENQLLSATKYIGEENLSGSVSALLWNEDLKFDEQFDIATFIASIHHTNPSESLAFASRNVKEGGKLLIFDGFFPMPVRESYTVLSKLADPTNRLHLTYEEVLDAVRGAGFDPLKIIPIRFKRSLEMTLNTYNSNDSIRSAVKELFLANETIFKQMHVTKEGDEWFYFYELFVLLAEKRTPVIITQY